MPSTSLVFDLIGRDHVSGPMGKAAVSMERTAASAKKSETALGGLMGSAKRMVPQLALLGGGFAAIKAAIDIGHEASAFQKQMLLIQTQAGATAGEIKDFSKAILSMSGRVAQAPEELATSLYHVYSTGLRGAKALKAVEIAARGARIGNADLEETTNALTATIASGVKGSGDFAKTMGMLNTVVGAGDMKLSDLNEALGTGFLGAAKAFGVSIKDAGALLAVFGDNNIRGAEAGTQLRMVMQDLSKPAATAGKALASVGLSAADLRKSMEKDGLAKTIQMLSQHMTEFGITGAKVGPFIEDVFTKKAGRGLGLILTQMDRLQQKLDEVGKGGSNFGASWTATTHTAAFAFARLKDEATSAGIVLYNKLLPSVTSAALWLGQKLPAAVSTVAHVVGPLAEQVGTVLGGAWHLVAGAISVAATGLSTIGGVLSRHRTIVSGVGAAVLGMWAAYKGFRIASAALTALDLALGRMAMRMNRAGGAMAGIQGGLRGLSTSAVAGGAALAGVGLALYAYSTATSQAAAIAARHRAEVDSLTQAIEQDSGALGKNTREAVENMLVQSGMYRTAADLGISSKELTDALLGNAAAMADVNAKAKVGTKDAVFFRFGLKGLSAEVKTATQNAKDKAAADGIGTAATKAMTTAAKAASSAQHKVAKAEDEAANAAKRLDKILQILSGRLGSRQALDQFRQGVHQLKGELDKHNHSLEGNSSAAIKNRLAVDQVVQSMLQYGDALKQQGKTQPQINSALQKQAQYLIDNAKQMGITKGQLRQYLHELHLTPKQIKTIMGVDDSAARAQIRALRQWFASLTWVAHVSADGTVSAGGTSSKASARASGGGLPEGVSAVGERGPELAIKSGRHVEILSNRQSKNFLAATGMKAPGFADGTKPKSYTYGGQEYASQRAANNARNRDRQQVTQDAGQAIAALKAAAHNFLSTGTDLKDAAKQLRDAAKAGNVSAALLAKFSRQSSRLTRLGNRRDRVRDRLGTALTPMTAYDRLANAQQNYRDERSSVKGAITGSFDITTAGQSQYGEPVTLGSIRRQLAKAVANAKRFTMLLRRLGKEGLNKTLLSQLAEAGPSALPQAEALASATPKELASINSQYRQLNKAGGSAGKYLANQMYGAGVDSAQALVNGLKSKEAALTKAIRRLAKKMVKELRSSLDMHSPSRVLHNEARLAFTGYEQGIKSKYADIGRASRGIGNASVQSGSKRWAGGHGHGGGTNVHIEKQELHVHYPLGGDMNEALKQLGRTTVSQIRAAVDSSEGLDR